jgi:hypothetical protein
MKRSHVLICLSLCFFVSSAIYFIKEGNAGCAESGPGGRLTRGIITVSILSSFVHEMLSMRNNEGGTVEVFTVQKPDGWYAKVCNDASMKQHFYENFGITGGSSNSGWKCIEICGSVEQLSERFSNRNGIQKIKMIDGGDCSAGAYKWEICSY